MSAWSAVDEQAWRECAHRADYLTPAEHANECAYHRGEVDENGLPIKPAPARDMSSQVCPKCGDPLTTGCRPADGVCVVVDDDREHCGNDCGGVYEDGERVEEPEQCVCCPCCCDCLGCVYAPQDGMLLTAEQRAGIGAGLDDDVAPNAGSQS